MIVLRFKIKSFWSRKLEWFSWTHTTPYIANKIKSYYMGRTWRQSTYLLARLNINFASFIHSTYIYHKLSGLYNIDTCWLLSPPMPMSTHISHTTDSSPYVVGYSIVDFTHWSCIGTGNRTTLYLLALPSAVRVTCGLCVSKPHTKIGLIYAWINFTGLSSMLRIMQ